jgi:hypothetical protein
MISTDELRKAPLFAGLAVTELDYLARSVADIVVASGEYVFNEDQHDPALFVIIEGRFELTKTMEGEERIVGVRLPGTFIAEPSIVLNVPFLASMRATERSFIVARLVGPRWQPSVHTMCDFLQRNQIDFEWLAPEDQRSRHSVSDPPPLLGSGATHALPFCWKLQPQVYSPRAMSAQVL